jgi:hypothetical protein
VNLGYFADVSRFLRPVTSGVRWARISTSPVRTSITGPIQALLTPLFHPDLAMPQRETPLHEGRKRIDLTYSNLAQSGFFAWVSKHHPAMYLLIECKNYTGDPANPELDQLAGRFGPSRGQVGDPRLPAITRSPRR